MVHSGRLAHLAFACPNPRIPFLPASQTLPPLPFVPKPPAGRSANLACIVQLWPQPPHFLPVNPNARPPLPPIITWFVATAERWRLSPPPGLRRTARQRPRPHWSRRWRSATGCRPAVRWRNAYPLDQSTCAQLATRTLVSSPGAVRMPPHAHHSRSGTGHVTTGSWCRCCCATAAYTHTCLLNTHALTSMSSRKPMTSSYRLRARLGTLRIMPAGGTFNPTHR